MNWPDLLAAGLADAVGAAVDVAGGVAGEPGGRGRAQDAWRQALNWFISSYPLLGALAAAFKLVEDAEVCRLHGIAVAAISPAAAELYVNPLCGLEDGERRFVIAHELLHAGLRHDTRGGGRDPWLWNVACDYVINGWLAEMEVGDLPDSALYDPSLRGKSAEEVYDQIAAGRRRTWKLATMRGPGACDILPRRLAGPDDPAWGVDLDEFYRRCLADGLDYHRGQGRGLLPPGSSRRFAPWRSPRSPGTSNWRAGSTIISRRWSAAAPTPGRAAASPRRRTFPGPAGTCRRSSCRAGPSASSSTPAARWTGGSSGRPSAPSPPTRSPGTCRPCAWSSATPRRTTTAGCTRSTSPDGCGSAAAAAPFCSPASTCYRTRRISPKDGPILVITDARIDRVRIKRDHAFLIPAGAVLPFPARGPVFRFS